MVRARLLFVYKPGSRTVATHTYLDGISPFMYPGWWAVETLHSTATMSSEGVCGLYGLRLMHRLNIFRSCFGHSGWAGSLFSFLFVLTLTLIHPLFGNTCAEFGLVHNIGSSDTVLMMDSLRMSVCAYVHWSTQGFLGIYAVLCNTVTWQVSFGDFC